MLDVDSIRWQDNSITLKETKKRSNRVVYFDDECSELLQRWLAVRQIRAGSSGPLWTTTKGRISNSQIGAIVQRVAIAAGLHDSASPRSEDHFSPHCCRHFFTTALIRSGMPRDFVKELRGTAAARP